MNKAVKGIFILYCLGVILACIYVPWERKEYAWRGGERMKITKKGGYSFIWSPYKGITGWGWDEFLEESIPIREPYDNIDFSRILLEIIALTGVAGSLVLIFWRKREARKKEG